MNKTALGCERLLGDVLPDTQSTKMTAAFVVQVGEDRRKAAPGRQFLQAKPQNARVVIGVGMCTRARV